MFCQSANFPNCRPGLSESIRVYPVQKRLCRFFRLSRFLSVDWSAISQLDQRSSSHIGFFNGDHCPIFIGHLIYDNNITYVLSLWCYVYYHYVLSHFLSNLLGRPLKCTAAEAAECRFVPVAQSQALGRFFIASEQSKHRFSRPPRWTDRKI